MVNIQPITICWKCNSRENVQRVRRRISNGTYQVVDWCYACNSNAGKTHIISHRVSGDIDGLPIIADYTTKAEPCAKCGSTEGTEYHHWAPRHVFGWGCERWPGAYLCPVHHAEWHEKVEGANRWQKYQ